MTGDTRLDGAEDRRRLYLGRDTTQGHWFYVYRERFMTVFAGDYVVFLSALCQLADGLLGPKSSFRVKIQSQVGSDS